ncbi:MAG TPA: iron-containing alcohol dehydrogenase, partial [Bacillota bacterium]|nr:iron-containing alcohol dehydrogenase [Bacillota bacterium]
HGVAMAIFLPAVTEYNIPADLEKHVDIAKAMGVDVTGMNKEDAAMEGVKAMQRLCDDVKIPRMKDLKGIDPADFEAIAIASEKNVSTPSNPRKITAKEYLEIIKKVYEG